MLISNSNKILTSDDNVNIITKCKLFTKYLAPEGTKYVSTKNNDLILVPTRKVDISGFVPVLNKEMKGILGTNYTINDVFRLSYNSQRIIELRCKKRDSIFIDKKEVNINNFVISSKKRKDKKMKMFLEPPKFNGEIINLKIRNSKYIIKVGFKRVPNMSLNVISLESVDENLQILFNYDYYKKTANIKISIELKKEYKVDKILQIISIYNSLILGEAYFDNQKVPKFYKMQALIKEEKMFEKLLAIEPFFDRKFTIKKKTISLKTAKTIEELYQSLVNDKPIISRYKLNSLNYDIKNIEELSKTQGNSIILYYCEYKDFELFGSKKKFYVENCLVNGRVTRIDTIDDKCKLILDSKNNPNLCMKIFASKKDYEIKKIEGPEKLHKYYSASININDLLRFENEGIENTKNE